MKSRLSVGILMVLCIAAMGSAAPLCTSSIGSNVLDTGFVCELGTLTFSNFQAVGATKIDLMGATFNGSVVYLTFNPYMAPTQGPMDVYFYMTVSGAWIDGVDLINGGSSGTSIFERVCSSPIGQGNICPENTQVAEMTASGGNQAEVLFQGSYQTLYIYKDILVPENEHLSSFTQSFHIPEPMTFVLIGTGLLGLGLFGKRLRR